MSARDPTMENKEEGAPPADEPGGGPGPRKTVLLIEDAEADRDLYGSLLWYNGYEVVHASDGLSGVALASVKAPDLVLLDLTLPGISGVEVCRRLREMGLRIPIVILSAHLEEEMGEAAREAGADAYLEKPIDPFMVVREVLRRVGRAVNGGDS